MSTDSWTRTIYTTVLIEGIDVDVVIKYINQPSPVRWNASADGRVLEFESADLYEPERMIRLQMPNCSQEEKDAKLRAVQDAFDKIPLKVWKQKMQEDDDEL